MDKEKLEFEKLQLEVSELKKSVFRRPTFWISFLGLILAIAGFFAQSTISKYESVKAEATRIEAKEETEKALLIKSRAEEETHKAIQSKIKAEEETQNALIKKAETEEDLAVLRGQVDTLRSEIEAILNEIEKAKIEFKRTAESPALESVIKSAQQLEFKIGAVEELPKEDPVGKKEKRYYVIALTSAEKEDIENEINRVRRILGEKFEKTFPNIETYSPEGYLATLLISSESLPYSKANELKLMAIEAGFSKDTWLWQSNNSYFDYKRN